MSASGEREGVIKFHLDFTPGPAPLPEDIAEINAWREVLRRLGLIGQDAARYQGLGFGNISCRMPPWDASPEERAFVVSGTQTGHLPQLGPEHFVVVRRCQPQRNALAAEGPLKPSSESLTHGSLYALDASIRCVMHAHSPELWRVASALGLPVTRAEVLYGTPEMAQEVTRLWHETPVSTLGVFAMAGHEDGVVSFGADAASAGARLVTSLARALQPCLQLPEYPV